MPKILSLMELVDRILDGLEDGTLAAGFEEPIERGSATGSVSVVKDPEHSESLVVVRLSIMRVPEAAGAAFHERLLALNHASLGRAAFSIDADGSSAIGTPPNVLVISSFERSLSAGFDDRLGQPKGTPKGEPPPRPKEPHK